MIADLFITTKGRPDLHEYSLRSLFRCTPRHLFRLTVVEDSGVDTDGKFGYQATDAGLGQADHVILHQVNLGLGPSINQALSFIDSLKKWDGDNAPPLTVYLQDDIQYSEGWLERLSKMFFLFEKQYNLAFASGIESIEHPARKDIGNGMILKDWLRGTCLLARHETWMSMFPIPKVDPETGRERGKPHNGLGSGVDWHFMRVHPNSVCKTNRTNLVIPGLLQHVGFDRSTWLRRELPESESDKAKIREHFKKVVD